MVPGGKKRFMKVYVWYQQNVTYSNKLFTSTNYNISEDFQENILGSVILV